MDLHIVVYCESINRDLKTKPIYECRYDERLKTRVEESTRLTCTCCLLWIDKARAKDMLETVLCKIVKKDKKNTARSLKNLSFFLCLKKWLPLWVGNVGESTAPPTATNFPAFNVLKWAVTLICHVIIDHLAALEGGRALILFFFAGSWIWGAQGVYQGHKGICSSSFLGFCVVFLGSCTVWRQWSSLKILSDLPKIVFYELV